MKEMQSEVKNQTLFSVVREWAAKLRHRRVPDNKPQDHRVFASQPFDETIEQLFWHERHGETLSTLKTALLLGSAGFLSFIVLDIFNGGLSTLELIGRLMIVPALCALMLYLHLHSQPIQEITRVAKLGAALSVAQLIGILLVDANPAFYTETWTGLLPIYFFTYGQLFIPIAETVVIGWLAMLAMPLSGYLIGVEAAILIPSILILFMVNLFGFCTRCRMENHSRHAFMARRKAETTVEDKTLFLRQLSHNLRQPLQALSCYSSVLDAAYLNKPDHHLQPIVGKLGAAIDELNNAFIHILDIANLENGMQIPRLKSVEINVLLATLEDQYAPQAAKRGLRLKVKLRSQPPYSVHSDACILSQIIGNLIDNAIKYTLKGWILVEAVRIGGGRLKLRVLDTGIGISEQQQANIFKEFYRGHRRREDPHVHGLGIGLAYVLKAVEHLPDHALQVYSKSDRGSDFQLRLPIAGELPNYQCSPGRPDNNIGGSFVFVVDDDPEVLDALVEQLTGWGCLVQKASSITETQAALAENLRPPDLLITDFYLDNDETAHDVIAAIEADCGPVPTLILSAHAISSEEKARWPKNTLLLRKPANASALMEAMVKALGRLN
jgi:two-component system, sensor histidine kinase